MKPIDLFVDLMNVDEKTAERLKRGASGVRTIYSMAKLGRAMATKGNVAAALLDAGISMLDAIESYALFRQATEITKQLEAEGEMLRARLAELSKQFLILQEVNVAERGCKAAALKRQFATHGEEFRINSQNYQHCKDQLKSVGAALTRLRQDSAPACPHLRDLEKAYYRLVDAQIRAAIALIDN